MPTIIEIARPYILRGEAYSALQEHFTEGGFKDYTDGQKCMDRIKAIPAADVVEVVRCYECKFWEHRPDRQYDLCAYLIGAKHSCTPEDFCSRGERKDGGQDETLAGPYDLLYEEGGPDA